MATTDKLSQTRCISICFALNNRSKPRESKILVSSASLSVSPPASFASACAFDCSPWVLARSRLRSTLSFASLGKQSTWMKWTGIMYNGSCCNRKSAKSFWAPATNATLETERGFRTQLNLINFTGVLGLHAIELLKHKGSNEKGPFSSGANVWESSIACTTAASLHTADKQASISASSILIPFSLTCTKGQILLCYKRYEILRPTRVTKVEKSMKLESNVLSIFEFQPLNSLKDDIWKIRRNPLHSHLGILSSTDFQLPTLPAAKITSLKTVFTMNLVRAEV